MVDAQVDDQLAVSRWCIHGRATDLFAARLDQEQGVANATGNLVCMHALQGVHLVRVCAALLTIGAIP